MSIAEKKLQIKSHINRVATIHYMLRPKIETMFKQWSISPNDPIGKLVGPDFQNYYQYWTYTCDDRFFDMATFIRLGGVFETGFRDYYMAKKGHLNLVSLKNDPAVKGAGNIFQRVKSGNNLQSLFKNQILIDLDIISQFQKIKEFFIHRHLYVHNSGVVNEKYIEDLRNVTGIDLSDEFTTLGFPNQDCYYFKPLKDLNLYIEAARTVFGHLPD